MDVSAKIVSQSKVVSALVLIYFDRPRLEHTIKAL